MVVFGRLHFLLLPSLPFLPVSVCPERSTSLHLSFAPPLFVLGYVRSPPLLFFSLSHPSLLSLSLSPLCSFSHALFLVSLLFLTRSSLRVSLCTLPDYTYLVSRVRRILHHLCPFGVVFTGLYGCATRRLLLVAVHIVKQPTGFGGRRERERKEAKGETEEEVN